jgi:hypothetical protein
MEGLKSFAVELSCVDTTDMIFSWIEKEILGMRDNNGSSLPSREPEKGYDGWMKWLRSSKQNRKNSPITPSVEQGVDQGKESIGEESNSDR